MVQAQSDHIGFATLRQSNVKDTALKTAKPNEIAGRQAKAASEANKWAERKGTARARRDQTSKRRTRRMIARRQISPTGQSKGKAEGWNVKKKTIVGSKGGGELSDKIPRLAGGQERLSDVDARDRFCPKEPLTLTQRAAPCRYSHD